MAEEEEEEEEEEEIMIMEEEEKEMSTTTTTTTVLPQDILMDILSRLPANSLLSIFKLVCKPWRTLIQDPAFVKIHLSRGGASIDGGGGGGGGGGVSSNNNHSSLICKSYNDLYQLQPSFNFEGIPPIPATRLDFDSLPLLSRLVCSCNGLLCFTINDDENIILLNPTTRKYKLSPKQPIECPPNLHKYGPPMFGFGSCYDSTNNIDEYKVIRIVFFSGLGDNLMYYSRYQFDIYSMSSNSWRRETRNGGLPYVFAHQESGVFLNGALHWVARYTQTRITSTDSWDTIISFDIKDEEFGLVPIPLSFHPTDDDDPSFNMHEVILMNMKGCLSMIRLSDVNNNHIDVDLEIWVMKEYGVEESWTEEFVIRSSDSDPPGALSDFTIYWGSNAYVLKGDQILIEGMAHTSYSTWPPSIKLVLYDINERKIDRDFKRIGVPVPYEPFVDQVDYIETLVSLKSLLTSIEH